MDWQTPQSRHPICDISWALIEVPSHMVTTSLDEIFGAYLDGVKREAGDQHILSESDLRDALPWGLVHTCFYWSVMLGGIVHASSADDETANPLAFTIANVYAPRLEALLERFVPRSFTERREGFGVVDGDQPKRGSEELDSAYNGVST